MNIIAYSRQEIEADLTARVLPGNPMSALLIEATGNIATRLQLAFFIFMTGAEMDPGYPKCFSAMTEFVAKKLHELGIDQTQYSMAAQIVDRCTNLAISFEEIEKAIVEDIAATGGAS